eukprot:6742459-Prymnesium_polylepis.1
MSRHTCRGPCRTSRAPLDVKLSVERASDPQGPRNLIPSIRFTCGVFIQLLLGWAVTNGRFHGLTL